MNASFVHYLPIATTVISAAFLIVLLLRASKRNWAPHLMWWAVGVFFYGVGTFFESWITLGGNTLTLNRIWYWAGAILGGYPLATGSVYLVMNRKWANWLTGVSLVFVIFASVMVFMTPMDASKMLAHKPGGDVIEWQWVRLLTPFINLYAAFFLVGGAMWSSYKFFASGNQPKRAIGTALIAFGAILPGIGGSMAKGGVVEALYIGEFAGLIFIWIGYEFCIRAPAPIVSNKLGDEEPTGEPSPA